MDDKIQRAYKTKLVVNNHEANYLRGCAGLARFVYNWGLAESKRVYEETGKTPSARNVLKKQFNEIKRSEYPWVYDYPYTIVESAFDDLDNAFKHFFRRVKNGEEEPGYPKFKKRSSRKSFRLRGSIQIEGSRAKLPRIGWLRLAEQDYLPVDADVNSATLSNDAGVWFISVQALRPKPDMLSTRPIVLGVETGIRYAAVTVAQSADGHIAEPTIYENPRVFDKYAKKLARLNRELARRKQGGQNWRKTKNEIAKLNRRIRSTRDHVQHNTSADIVRRQRPREIVIAGHSVATMILKPEPVPTENGYAPNGAEETRGLRRRMADARMSELRRQVEYKSTWAGIQVEVNKSTYPATRMCSNCGILNALLPLNERTFSCVACGLKIDRDINAARNRATRREPVMHGGLPVELAEQSSTVKQETGAGE